MGARDALFLYPACSSLLATRSRRPGNRASRSAFRSVSLAVAVVVLDDQTRLADNAKVMCHRGLGHLDAEAKLHKALVAER